jgi:agmatinase
MTNISLLLLVSAVAGAREIVFPPVSGYTTDQALLGGYNDPDISQPKFAGLMTYANLPYVHCLAADREEVERFDIAILGAPFDTVSCSFLWQGDIAGAMMIKLKSSNVE